MRLGFASVIGSLLLGSVVVPSIASAGVVTVGVHAGSLQAEADASNKNDAQSEVGAFGRFALAERFSVQVDLANVSMRDESNLSLTSFTASAVLDLTHGSPLVPVFLVGLGIDHASSDYYDAEATRSEIGVGLEYRAKNGFLVGIDARVGNRKIDTEDENYNYADVKGVALVGDDSGSSNLPSVLSAGQYRSARLYAGLRF
ncbi:MAG TPA: outer membrane beta-barrel protein [Kofleriaceae bacterium]|jgi:hypothetical protein